ncbi:MAG: hypothetical protein HY804_05330 [Nitrospinae bacterium]|nr:hypothetical protein [Nitrospinota bacterium]
MGPIFDGLKAKYRGKPLRFVRFDVTDKSTLAAAREQARSLNLQALLDKEVVTGVMDLVDGKTGGIVQHFGWNSAQKEIAGALDKYLAGR